MKAVRNLSIGFLIPTLAAMFVHRFVTPLPDWAVIVCGVVTMIAMFALVFSTVRLMMRK